MSVPGRSELGQLGLGLRCLVRLVRQELIQRVRVSSPRGLPSSISTMGSVIVIVTIISSYRRGYSGSVAASGCNGRLCSALPSAPLTGGHHHVARSGRLGPVTTSCRYKLIMSISNTCNGFKQA